MWITKRFHVSIKWFDFWVGIYYDREDRTVFICPIPCLCFMYVLKGKPYEFQPSHLAAEEGMPTGFVTTSKKLTEKEAQKMKAFVEEGYCKACKVVHTGSCPTYKTSEEWQRLCIVEVLDPDGWDRINYAFSWYTEKITRGEFEKRLVSSTCRFPRPLPKNIWKDQQ